MKSTTKIAFLVSIIVLGVALSVIGAIVKSETASIICLAFGSGMMGAALSLFISAVSQSDVIDAIYKQLGERFDLLSEESEIRSIKKKLYHYHVTQIDGKKIWRFRVYDFSKSMIRGRLHTAIEAKDSAGSTRKYNIYGAARESRFIIFEKAFESMEPIIIEIYSTMMVKAVSKHAGIGFMQSWDGNNLITPCILSDSPIEGIIQEGDVEANKFEILENTWKNNIENTQYLLEFPK